MPNPSIAEMPTSRYQEPSSQPPVPKKQKLTQFPKLKHGNDKIIFTVSDEIHAKMLQKLHYESKEFFKKWQIPKLKDREAQKPILSRRLGELHWSRRFMHCLKDSEIKMFVVIGNIHLVKLGENISKKCKYLIC